MNREALRAALEKDRDERARVYATEVRPMVDPGYGYSAPSDFRAGADSRTDDILDLVEAIELYRREYETGYPDFHAKAGRREQLFDALKKLYAKYGGVK